MITMATNKEYEEWKKDPAAQQEYAQYLFEELKKPDSNCNQFIGQFTRAFNETCKEKS